MTERQQICAATTIGAALGALASYLFFTEPGRALRRRLLPALDEFEHDLNHFRSTIARTAGVAGEGLRMLNEAIAEASAPMARPSSHHQNIPF